MEFDVRNGKIKVYEICATSFYGCMFNYQILKLMVCTHIWHFVKDNKIFRHLICHTLFKNSFHYFPLYIHSVHWVLFKLVCHSLLDICWSWAATQRLSLLRPNHAGRILEAGMKPRDVCHDSYVPLLPALETGSRWRGIILALWWRTFQILAQVSGHGHCVWFYRFSDTPTHPRWHATDEKPWVCHFARCSFFGFGGL